MLLGALELARTNEQLVTALLFDIVAKAPKTACRRALAIETSFCYFFLKVLLISNQFLL